VAAGFRVLTLTLGFDLSEMENDVYKDTIVDVVPAESVVSDPCIIKVSYFLTCQQMTRN